MATGTAAMAQKLTNPTKTAKKSNGSKKISSAKKQSKKTSAPRVKHDYARIVKMYNDGSTWDEISKACKIKRSSMNGISDRLVVGIEINGKTLKIVRGKKGRKSQK